MCTDLTDSGLFSDDDKKKALCISEKVNVCQRCIGRFFGMIGHGLENTDRGAVLEKLGVPTVDENECEVCEGIFLSVDDYVDAAMEALNGYEFLTFQVGCRIDGEMTAREIKLAEECGAVGESIKLEFNRVVGKALQERLDAEGRNVIFSRNNPDITIIIDPNFISAELQVNPVYIFGRYKKFSREIPQTRWPCRHCRGLGCDFCGGTGKMYPTSVEEEIGRIALQMFEGEDHSFHGMGREDIDALMLGSGRPFVLEVKNPRKRDIDLKELERAVNSSGDKVKVELRGYVRRKTVRFIKSAKATKEYIISVHLEDELDRDLIEKALNEIRGKDIDQRTPQRVSHRRADKIRKRKVIDIELLSYDDGNAKIRIHGQAGLYIKELMTGDGERTKPSLAGLLGVPIQVNHLDVTAIHDEALNYPE